LIDSHFHGVTCHLPLIGTRTMVALAVFLSVSVVSRRFLSGKALGPPCPEGLDRLLFLPDVDAKMGLLVFVTPG